MSCDARKVRLIGDLESFEIRNLAAQALERLGELAAAGLRKRLAEKPALETLQQI